MIRRAATSLVVVAVVAGASTTHSTTASAAAIRNAYLQPFTSTSIWNQPVGTGAVYVPAQIAPPTIRSLTADETVALMDPSAPLTPIAVNGGQHSNRCIGGTAITTAPIPPALVVPSSTSNYGYAVVGADGSSLTEGGAFARCSPGAAATADSAKAYGSIYGDGLTGGAGGSGLSILGGLLRVNELVPGGQIQHAVRVNLDGASDLFAGPGGFRWPATREDGYGSTYYGGHNPALKMGALLALPANLNLASLGLTSGPGMILAQALQHYGAYVSNDTGRPVFSIDTETGDASMINQFQSAWGYPFVTAGVGGSPWANDIMSILNNLSVVDNNSAASIGGGGTPLVPLAPPLAVGAQPSAPVPQHFAPTRVGAPQVAVTPDGSTQLVFWRGANNQLAEAWYTGAWNGPVGLPQLGTLTSTPAVAVSKDGGTQLVFWQGSGGHLMEAWWNGHWNGPVDWTATNRWPASVGSAPSVAFAPDGTQLIFWRGGGGHLDEVWWNGHWNGPVDWTAANRWPASVGSAPSVAFAPNGTQLIFWQGAGGHLQETWWNGHWNGPVDWTAANRWPASVGSAPSVAFAPDGTQLIFWQGPGGHLQETWWNGHWNGPVDWTAANRWPASVTSAPSAAVQHNGTQVIFWQGAGGHLVEVWWNGHWNGPVDWSA